MDANDMYVVCKLSSKKQKDLLGIYSSNRIFGTNSYIESNFKRYQIACIVISFFFLTDWYSIGRNGFTA